MPNLTRIGVLFVLVVGLTAGAVGLSAPAKAETAESFVEKVANKGVALVTQDKTRAEKRADFDKLLADYFDMPAIGRFLVGRYWRTASAEEQQAYIEAFTQNIVYTYTARFDDYQGQEVSVTGSREDGRFTLVNSVVQDPKGQSPDVSLDWRLHPAGDTFKVIDLVVEGVSMSVTQRQEYTSVIQSNGGKLTALTDALNKQMQRLTGG